MPSPNPTLVLLPGLDGTGKRLAEFVAQLGADFDVRIVGYPPRRPLAYDALEQLVRAELPRDRAYVLLGESFSGPIAARIAADSPMGLAAVILCASFVKSPYPLLRWAAPLAAYAPVKSMPRWLRGLMLWGSGSSGRIPTQAQRASAGVDAAVLRARLAALLTVDASTAATRVRVPMLVICARNDRLVGQRCAREILESAPHAEFVALEGPHLLLQTRPRECADLVARFIGKLGSEI
ncbi:MAG TPA: alpha/beta fold hydrolase [Steroidobacteraceae bacterium]|nr:alpha/beta fold hydrolase [Steroidobacteraceae bacterium]